MGEGGAASRQGYEVVLTVSPLAATEEVLALFQGGIADYEAAAPLALNAIGLNGEEIQRALKRQKQREAEEKAEKTKLESEAKEQRKSAASQGSQGSTSTLNIQMVPPAGMPVSGSGGGGGAGSEG